MAFTDTDEQRAVIQAPADRHVLVVAGAGSGKTYTMTRRIITLINDGGVSADRILGLTFTRKAAASLLGRVSTAVHDNLQRRDHDHGAGSRRASGSDGMFLKPTILTYDAFFHSIVQRYGLLVGMDQDTQLLSGAGARQLAADVVGRHLPELLGTFGDRVDGAEAGDDDPGDFGTLVAQVTALAQAIANSMIGGDVLTFDDAVRRIREWDRAFVDRVRVLVDEAGIPGTRPEAKSPSRNKNDSDERYAAKAAKYAEDLRLRELFDRKTEIDAVLGRTARRELLLGLVEEYQRLKRERGLAEFSDFTIAAYRLVRRFPSIGEEYRRRYTHVFLDEYQDTSTTQASLLTALFHVADDGTHGDGRFHDSAITAVGDPFQSIYAWRGASPGAFRMLQRDLDLDTSDSQRQLTQTRRNSRLVLEAANNLTALLRRDSGVHGSAVEREVGVKPLSPMDDAVEGTLGVQGFATLGEEVDAVARFAATAASTYGDGRHGDGPHVAVLFRSKGDMPMYRDAMERQGLACQMVGYSALVERPETMDLLAVLKVVSDHTDNASLMRLLATTRFGMDPDDLRGLGGAAERENGEYRYRALVEAGLATGSETRDARNALLRRYRDETPNGVYLADLLMRDDCDAVLKRCGVGDRGRMLAARAGSILKRVEAALHRPLTEVLRVAAEALDLDVDCKVAQALKSRRDAKGGDVDPAASCSSLTAVGELAESYLRELTAGMTPTLRGFLAWVDSMDDGDGRDAAVAPDASADVMLMTIHQAKGLEWDAVAVVGLRKGAFPGGGGPRGDRLSVEKVEKDDKGDAAGELPVYRETVGRTWLNEAEAVPAPVRVDRMILPRFPHDSDPDADPSVQLAGIRSFDQLYREIFGHKDEGDMDDDAGLQAILGQSHEYGRRRHADDRRLMYVALTRARYDVLVTYCENRSSTGFDPFPGAGGDGKNKLSDAPGASNFWTEIHESITAAHGDRLCRPEGVPDALVQANDGITTTGCFVGDRAAEYERAVIGGLWSFMADRAEETEEPRGRWPCRLRDDVADSLRRSASAVRRHMDSQTASDDAAADDEGLYGHALRLIAESRRPDGSSGTTLDALRSRGERILAAGSQSVTAIQRREGVTDERDALRYWSGIVRPVPHVSSPQAQAGTRFHEWAARFILPAASGPDGRVVDVAQARAALLRDLGRSGDGTSDTADRNLLTWQRRLASSPWADRRALWVERPIVVSVKGKVVNGKLDAVFAGGLDPDDPARLYTVVDWKTGRRPTSAADAKGKLVQLDLYRLLLSRIENVPVEQIDAALYYVSERSASRRLIVAEPKTEDEIIAAVRDNPPALSDDD